MDKERAKRLFAACMSSGIILLFILLSILFYQGIIIKKTQVKIQGLRQEIEVLEQEKEQTEDKIEIWLTNWKITERANELGYIYGEDK